MLNTIRKTALGIVTVAALSAPAFANRNNTPAYMAEIDSCIAELTRRIDVDDAERLRHVITKSRRSGSRYALSFKTTVFTPNGESNYSVYCVASGSNAPIAFKVKEQDS